MKAKEENNKLIELAKELERQKMTKIDFVKPCNQIQTLYDVGTNTIKLSIPEKRQKLKFDVTEYCHGQIASKTNIPWVFYERLRASHPKLLVKNINELIMDKEMRLVRTLDGKARALLSDKYRYIENYDVLFNSMDEFKRLNAEEHRDIVIENAQLTDTNLYIKATSRKLVDEIIVSNPNKEWGHRDEVRGGIIISNSEVGAGAYTVRPFMYVQVCKNGLIRDVEIRRVHLGKKLEAQKIIWSERTVKALSELQQAEDKVLWASLTDMIAQTFDPSVFSTWVDEINRVASEVITKPIIAVNHIIKNYNEIPKHRAEELLNEFAHFGYTKWGLSQSITHLAQSKTDYDLQVAMERLGNNVLQIPVEVLEAGA